MKDSAEKHRSYKLYTSMERALGFLVSGRFFLTNGETWNDTFDREQVKEKDLYSTSLSWSTRENVAMWMLYGRKNGAMLNFYSSIIKEIINAKKIHIGFFFFFESGKFKDECVLIKENNDYEIFISDVVYFEEYKKDKVVLTLGDEHATTERVIINHKEKNRSN